MAKRVSTRRVKKDRHYTYQTAADVLGLTPHTIRSWRSLGLKVMMARTPHYILGAALIEFVDQRQAKLPTGMALDQMYCVHCRQRQTSLGAMVDYIPRTDTRGRIVGLCSGCEQTMHRFTSKAELVKFSDFYEIVIKDRAQA
jgi:hypothetical protein